MDMVSNMLSYGLFVFPPQNTYSSGSGFVETEFVLGDNYRLSTLSEKKLPRTGSTRWTADQRKMFSAVARPKIDETMAQTFRTAIFPLGFAGLWDDDLAAELLTRFPRVAICARPPHLFHAYSAAVTTRVLRPAVWQGLPLKTKRA